MIAAAVAAYVAKTDAAAAAAAWRRLALVGSSWLFAWLLLWLASSSFGLLSLAPPGSDIAI